jgi:cysteine synthase A
MVDLTINEEQLEKTIHRVKERNIIIPTFQQQIHPEKIPEKITSKLSNVGLWEVNPLNLFRIGWKNEPKEKGGMFGGVNYMEIPSALTGVKARIFALIGKWFPTGAHKVGATFGCLVPRLVTGQFDPTSQKAVWPSTGNYCRGGAYDSALLACDSIAILPEEMSRERFEWLEKIAGEVIATPGSESNVKEIYDKCRELRKTREDIVIFNQFDEFGNYLWHYQVTGKAIEEVLQNTLQKNDRYSGIVLSTGSAGTLGCGDYLKQKFPQSKIAAAEALQCPTLLLNGHGAHRIEGIGDKHVPWIHNVRNTDMVIAVDDEFCMNLIRLLNEHAGKEYLAEMGLSNSDIEKLPLVGISGIGNLIASIKFAKYYELTERDVVFTVFTDSMELYQSRLRELLEEYGNYTRDAAIRDYHRFLMGISTDYMMELSHYDRKRIHHLKYFTWIEQQGRKVDELNAQWYDYPDYWERIQNQVDEIDERIEEFNDKVGLL